MRARADWPSLGTVRRAATRSALISTDHTAGSVLVLKHMPNRVAVKSAPARRAAVLMALLVTAFGCGSSGGATAEPDIVYRPYTELELHRPDAPDVEVLLADPHVIKVDHRWYLYGTSSDEGFECWSSGDLAEWRYEGLVWRPTPGTWNDQRKLWAPHVQPARDGYYLYYSANYRIGVAFSTSPAGPFEELRDGPFVGKGAGGVGDGHLPFAGTDLWYLDFDEFAIDAAVYEGRDGSLTFYFSRYQPWSVIQAIPMEDHATLAAVPPRTLLDARLASWECLTREGPFVIEHGGTIHLMYSGGFYFLPTYAVGDSLGSDPLGPFERRTDNPILATTPSGALIGPGHHSVVAGAHHDLLMFFHTKVSSDSSGDRRVRYVPISFDADGRIQLDVPPP